MRVTNLDGDGIMSVGLDTPPKSPKWLLTLEKESTKLKVEAVRKSDGNGLKHRNFGLSDPLELHFTK